MLNAKYELSCDKRALHDLIDTLDDMIEEVSFAENRYENFVIYSDTGNIVDLDDLKKARNVLIDLAFNTGMLRAK